LKSLIAFFVLTAMTVSASAAEAKLTGIEILCQKKADQALAKVAEALGMGKGVGHIGGSDLTEKKTDSEGNLFMIFNGGPLASQIDDGYRSGTGAVVRMVVAGKASCLVDNVVIDTGASFQVRMKRDSLEEQAK
jgi:hypothetical protein